jgi:hypothetical protein
MCQICGKMQKYLASHLLSHEDKPLQHECIKCGKKYRTYPGETKRLFIKAQVYAIDCQKTMHRILETKTKKNRHFQYIVGI